MAIFDPAIFDGTTGGLIFDDDGVAPAAKVAASQTLFVRLVATTLAVILGKTTIPVNLEGSFVPITPPVTELRIIEGGETRVIEDGEERAIE